MPDERIRVEPSPTCLAKLLLVLAHAGLEIRIERSGLILGPADAAAGIQA